jgi:hypothetical protein
MVLPGLDSIYYYVTDWTDKTTGRETTKGREPR